MDEAGVVVLVTGELDNIHHAHIVAQKHLLDKNVGWMDRGAGGYLPIMFVVNCQHRVQDGPVGQRGDASRIGISIFKENKTSQKESGGIFGSNI